MPEGKKSRITKVKCELCGRMVRSTKIGMVPFASRRKDRGNYEVKACPRCYNKEMSSRRKGQVPFHKDDKPIPTKSEPIRAVPKSQSIESDKRPAGYVHVGAMQELVPIGLQEHGKVTLDAVRLNTQSKAMLAAELKRIVRQLTGHKCYELRVKSIKIEYKVKHTR